MPVLKAETGKKVELDDDQIQKPIYVLNTAKILEIMAMNKLTGKFNYCNGLQITRFQIAKKLQKLSDVKTCKLHSQVVSEIWLHRCW